MRRPRTFVGLPQLETPAQAEARNLRRIDALVDRARHREVTSGSR
jgi:hypothetical protein